MYAGGRMEGCKKGREDGRMSHGMPQAHNTHAVLIAWIQPEVSPWRCNGCFGVGFLLASKLGQRGVHGIELKGLTVSESVQPAWLQQIKP